MMQKSRMILWFLLAAIFSAAAVTPLSAASRGISVTTKQGKPVYLYKDYHALVVGVSEYESWPDLPNAVRDAREVAAELKKSGFLVELIVNPDSKQLKSAMSTLAYKKGRESDRAVLFYFAGHGETTTLADGTELGYIIPRDCPLKRADPMGFDEKALSMNQVETCSMKVASKHVLMVFDSCFSGSLFNMTRAAPTDISEKSASPVRQYITAGAAGEQVPDKSIFKTVFLDGIKGEADLNSDGYVTGSELGMHLQDKVVNYTRGCQHPQYGKINNPRLDKGDFIFMLASSGATVETPSASKEKAYLNVTANTQGAQVLIDGRSAGNAPLSGIELAPGNHTVRVEKAGYVAYSKQVKLSSGRSISLQAFLSPQAPETGRLFLETNPKGAHVRILNINPVYYEGMELEPGRYHVEVSASGYETSTQWVSLVAGEDKYLSMGLKEKAVAVQGGRLTEITDTHQTAASGNRITVESIGYDMVYISPGTFRMGSPSNEPQRDSDEMQHKVTLSKGYYMGVTEVTQAQWRKVMGSNPSKFSNCDNCPVEQVSWNDAQEFIKKLNRMEGTDKYRLPSEAQWEYACRAGTDTPFNTRQCLSADQANYNGNYPMTGCSKGTYRKKTLPVKSFSPNAWGLYEMHGNVWEWCSDWKGDYPSGSVTDPQGPSEGSYRVSRGGGWDCIARSCRSASRGDRAPSGRRDSLGLRLSRTP